MAEVSLAADLSVQYFIVNEMPTKPAILQVYLFLAQKTRHNDSICAVVAYIATLILQDFSTLYKVSWNFIFFLLSSYLCPLTLNICILSSSWLVSRVNISVIQLSSVCSWEINHPCCNTMSLSPPSSTSTKAAERPLHFGLKAADWSRIITPNMLPKEA